MRVQVNSDQIKSAFEAVKHDHSFDESRSLYDQGRPPSELIQALCLRPELLKAFGQFGDCLYPGGLLSRREKELVIIESSLRNRCQFCADSHMDVVAMSGAVENPQHALQNLAGLSERERLAIEYTRAMMTDSNRVPEAIFTSLRARFSEPEIVELTFLIGYINMLNMFNNALQVRYHGEYAEIKN